MSNFPDNMKYEFLESPAREIAKAADYRDSLRDTLYTMIKVFAVAATGDINLTPNDLECVFTCAEDFAVRDSDKAHISALLDGGHCTSLRYSDHKERLIKMLETTKGE